MLEQKPAPTDCFVCWPFKVECKKNKVIW